MVLLLSGCATDNLETLRSEVNQLKRGFYSQRQEVKALREAMGRLEGASSAQAVTRETLDALRESQARLHSQLTELNRDIQILQGSYDESRFATEKALKDSETERSLLRAQIEELEKEVNQLEARMQVLQERIDSLAKAPPPAETPGPPEKQAPVTDEEVYKAALATLKEGKFAEARKAFEDFLKRFPDSRLSDNAHFWIAESYYKEGNQEEAILAYETLIRKFPKSEKVPGAMLKQAYAFLELGDRNTAKVILTTVRERFPKSKEAGLAEKKLKELTKGKKQ